MAIFSGRVLMLEHDPAFAGYMELAVDAEWQKYSKFYASATRCTVDLLRLTGGLQWCDGGATASGITVMSYSTSDYDAPLLQVNPVLEGRLKQLFPEGNVFHKVGRFLFRPSARVVEAVKAYDSLAADCLVGMQIRQKKPLPAGVTTTYPILEQYAAVLRAVSQNAPGNVFVASDTDIMVELAALLPDRHLWWTNETRTTIGRPLSAGDNPGSDLSAFVDVLLLSKCKHIVITAGSSFGVLAAALRNSNPIHVVMGNHDRPFYSPWFWASVTSEPCIWRASLNYPQSGMTAEVRAALKRHPLYWYFEQCN